MKYIECKSKKYSILNNTTNCVKNIYYNDYYIKNIDDNITVLYPCSKLDKSCYECDPELETIGKCLSCIPRIYIYSISSYLHTKYRKSTKNNK
jgi:hypothetical protein